MQQLACPPQAPTQGSCGSVTTDTVYLGGDDAEEIASNGSIVTSTTKTYSAGSLLLGTLIASGGTESLHVLASDELGSVTLALDTSGNLTAQQLYDPYGNVRYSFGSMPTTKGYTGQQGDSLTGLDYYGARYYDPLVGQFLTPDDVDAAGPNRYGYVGGNPTTHTDPNGHCWLVCAVVAAVVAAVATAVVVTVVDAVVQQVTTGQVDWGSALKMGATSGLMVGAAIALGPAAAAVEGTIAGGLGGGAVASVAAAGVVGAGEGAAFQIGDNVVNGRDWRSGVGQAALIGGVSAGVLSGGGEVLGALRAAGADAGDAGDGAAADFCGLSFAPSTPVATPGGHEQPIASLRVGDHVEAYDASTGQASVQQVQRVFVDHDTDLLDVTLQTTQPATKQPAANQQAASANHHYQGRTDAPGTADTQETETIHTTANHPWLTADRGWEQAGALRVGEPVVTANDGTAVVVALRVVPGSAAMWDLTVSNVHDFAVGAGQFVVHNCDFKSFYGNNKSVFESMDEAKAAYRTINRALNGAKSWAEDGRPFENWAGDLTGGRRYTEWTVHYGDTVLGDSTARGLRRIVLGNDGSIWFTGNHYGDLWAKWAGGQPFYRLWWR